MIRKFTVFFLYLIFLAKLLLPLVSMQEKKGLAESESVAHSWLVQQLLKHAAEGKEKQQPSLKIVSIDFPSRMPEYFLLNIKRSAEKRREYFFKENFKLTILSFSVFNPPEVI